MTFFHLGFALFGHCCLYRRCKFPDFHTKSFLNFGSQNRRTSCLSQRSTKGSEQPVNESRELMLMRMMKQEAELRWRSGCFWGGQSWDRACKRQINNQHMHHHPHSTFSGLWCFFLFIWNVIIICFCFFWAYHSSSFSSREQLTPLDFHQISYEDSLVDYLNFLSYSQMFLVCNQRLSSATLRSHHKKKKSF